MTTQQISVSEFKAHCAEQLRKVETEGVALQITRHGKVVALVKKPEEEQQEGPQTLADLIGSMRGTVIFSDDYDPDEPTFAAEDWEDHPANQSEG
ncbi:MAG: type II toxin-antitoxin system Phd/YefM family antitoxin [Verrucomicrobiales bacterium]|nr:type II toxin-antitoxin system Phd/YefM family antitoxin [Verrucomicrobiales bacterium]